MKWILTRIVLLIVCYAISVMFFLNSGLIDVRTGELNEQRFIQTVEVLDDMPFFHADVDDFLFEKRERISHVGQGYVSITWKDTGEETRYASGSLQWRVGEHVKVYYTLDSDGHREIVKIR